MQSIGWMIRKKIYYISHFSLFQYQFQSQMKFDLTSFDENAFKAELKEPHVFLQKLRELSQNEKKLKQTQEGQELSEETKEQLRVIEEEFLQTAQKLVKSPLTNINKFFLSQVKDIFNALSEKIEKFKDGSDKPKLLLLLQAAAMIAYTNNSQEKVDNVNVLDEILKREDDPRMTLYALEMIQTVGSRRTNDYCDRAVYLCLAPNHLVSKEKHVTMFDIAKGTSKDGSSLVGADLFFEIEKQAFGLNDRSSTEVIRVPRSEFEGVLASEKSKQLAESVGKENEPAFYKKLEAKISWLKFVSDENSLVEVLQVQNQALALAYNWKSESRHQDYISYVKESYIKEAIEMLKESGNKDLMFKIVLNMQRLVGKDQVQYINLDLLTKPQPKTGEHEEEREETSVLVKLMKDMASVKIVEDGLMVEKQATTEFLNSIVAKSSHFQFGLLSLVYLVIRVLQASHSRSNNNYQEVVNGILESTMKILDEPVQFGFDVFHPKVVFTALHLLRACSRPRLDEQFDLVRRLSKRLLFENENLQKNYSFIADEEDLFVDCEQKERQNIIRQILLILTELLQRDTQNVGISRRIQDAGVLANLQKLLQFNNPDQGNLIDEILPKYIAIFGQICSNEPGLIPGFIKSGLLTEVLASLDTRLPNSPDTLDSLIFSICQFAIHQEGQEKIIDSNIFKTLLERAIVDDKDNKVFSNLAISESQSLKILFSNLFDRNEAFKIQMKEILENVYLNIIQRFISSETVNYLRIIRQSDKTISQKLEETGNLKQQKNYSQVMAAINMILIVCQLTNDNMGHHNQSRHVVDIMQSEVCEKLMSIFELIGQVPSLNDLFNQFKKIMKALVESTQFPTNYTSYIDRFQNHLVTFQSLIVKPLPEVTELDYSFNDGSEIADLNGYISEEKERFLTRGEALLFQTSLVLTYTKTTTFLHNQTQLQLYQHKQILKILKPLFYLMRISAAQEQRLLNEAIEGALNDSQNQNETELKQAFTQENDPNLSVLERNQQYQLLQTVAKARNAQSNNPQRLLIIRRSHVQDLYCKLSACSLQLQQVRQGPRETAQMNLHFIGKIMYKLSKEFKKEKFPKASELVLNDVSFFSKIQSLQQNLIDFSQLTIKCWLDGPSFFTFFKKGGFSNIISCFKYLGTLLPVLGCSETKWSVPFTYIYDDCCLKIKEFLQIMIQGRNSDSHIQSIISMKMGGDIDSPKALYQTFYHELCSKLLEFSHQSSERNILKKYQSNRCTYLQDVILNLLQQASKSFTGCQLIKENARPANNNRGRVDQAHVQSLLAMGLTDNRERVEQALQQAHNNVENAASLLLEMNMMNAIGIADEIEPFNGLNIQDGLSSNQSRDEGITQEERVSNLLDTKMPDISALVHKKRRQPKKVDDQTFQDTLKKTQLEGFNWIIDMIKADMEVTQTSQYREQLVSIMLSEKNEGSQKTMFQQINMVFSKNLDKLNSLIQEQPEQKDQQSQDQVMTDVTTETKTNKKLIESMRVVSSDCAFIQKLINSQKAYFKEAVLKCFTYSKFFVSLKYLATSFRQNPELETDGELNGAYQQIILDVLILMFSIYQLTQMQITMYHNAKAHQDQCQKKISLYTKEMQTVSISERLIQMLEEFSQLSLEQPVSKRSLKKPILTTLIAFIFRILMTHREWTDANLKQQYISKLFDIINSIRYQKVTDNQILTSVSILHFENQKSLQNQMEKLVQKTLWMKFEQQSKEAENSKNESEVGHLLSKTNFNSFLSFFQPLSHRDQESFKNVVAQSCEVKTIKKMNTLSQDQAIIRLKEPTFNELKKQIQKERGSLKQFGKLFDFGNDKALKTQSKQSKKALLLLLNDSQQQAFQTVIQQIAERTSQFFEEFVTYGQLNSQDQKFLVPKSQLKSFSQNEDLSVLVNLFKLSQAYPAATVCIMKSHPQPKKSFFNWLMRDFLVYQMIHRSVTEQKPTNSSTEVKPEPIYEISYSLPTSSIKPLDTFILRSLNSFSGYNHLMTLNEQMIKHEVRTKLMLEALTSLHKSIKATTQSNQASANLASPLTNQIKQKCQIITSLSVIDSLVNYEGAGFNRQQAVAQDNFSNSIRVAIVREASTKDSNLPPSFVKIIEELLTEVIDVTLPANADVINRSVQILKNIVDFMNAEKKKEEIALNQLRPSTDRSVLEERKEPREQVQLGSPRIQAGSPRLQALGAEQIEALSEDSHDDMALQPNPDVEDDEGIDDEDEDDEDQDDDDDNDDDDDDNDGDEEEKLDDDAVMFIQEEEDDESDQELELHRQDGDHDLFAEEEEDIESQEEIGLNHEQPADRGMRALDIINAFNREQRPARQQYRDPRAQRAQVPESEWSQDEITVQRLLSNMRQAQAIQAVPPSVQQVARAALGNPFQAPPWEGGHQAQEEKKTTIIEQIYDGLKMISEKDLADTVNTQRQILKMLIKEENQNRDEEQKQGNRQHFEGDGRHMILNPHQLNRIILEEGEEFPILDGANPFRHHELARLLGARNQFIEDPMFARPVFQEFLAQRGAGGWGAHNDIIFGHGAEFEDLPHHHGIIPPNPAANENNLFSHYLRNLNQNQANQNEGLGQQLLEVVTVQVEEVKEEPAKKIPTPPLQVDPLNPVDMSNDFLLGSIFGSRQNPPVNESRNAERDQLRDMIQQNSRALNESMQNIQRENQQRMESLGLDQVASSRNMIEPRARSGEAILVQSQQPQPLEMIRQQQVPVQNEAAQDEQQPLIQEQVAQSEQIRIEGAQVLQPRPLSPVQQPESMEDEEMKVVEEEVKQPEPIQEVVKVEEKQVEQQIQQEEVKNENQVEVQINAQEAEQPEQQQPSSGKTFGYDNALLEAHGIDPAILAELPEDVRAELLSGIDTNVVLEEPVAQQQQQQQQPAAQNEEEKQGEPAAAQQQQNNLNTTLANELGLDPEFLANLPEDMQLELIQNAQFRERNMSGSVPAQQQPRREAEQMDIASFIATVTEPGLRRDIFAGMDEGTISTLPPNLMAEARRVHENLRGERVRQRENLDAMERLAARAHHHIGQGRDGMDALFGNRYRAGGHREEQKQQQPGGKSLDDVITQRQKALLDELCSNEDTVNAISQAVVSNDKVVETLLLILISNEKVECELIPCIQSFTRVLNQGVPIIRNKVVNAIIFTIKTLALNDSEALTLLYPGVNIKKNLSILMLVGCLRLLLRNNRSLMKYILKGLIYKEDQNLQFKNPQILKRQYKALKMIKSTSVASDSQVQQEDQLMQQVTPQRVTVLPPLVEIFSLIKTEAFKQDKTLMRNLSLLIHQILKQIEIASEELNTSNQTISSETIQSIGEVLSLDIIDTNLLQDLGEFLYQISKKSKENFDLVSSYCVNRSNVLVEKLLGRLQEISGLFSDITSKISPSKLHVVDVNYSPGQLSAYEEEKSEQMQVDTATLPSLDLAKNTSDNRSYVIKLPDSEEKLLKQSLRVHEESEILLRIFKLYNLFYEKFNKDKNEIVDARMDDDQSVEPFKEEDAIQSIQVFFTQDQVKQFTNRVSDILKIVYKTNIEINDGVSNLIFCVFLSFYPEIYQSNQLEEKMNKELAEKDKTEKSKYKIKMLPLSESTHKQQEKFTLFRNTQFLTSRIDELNRFCLVNKRVINKLIKQKISIFINELEVLIQLMPNLLDFENKRTYFKKELTKLKRSHHHDQLQLYIRRDDIFMDSYAQLGPKPADEMKGRLHISFTGERGQDAGGLTRDFFTELSREMFNPNYSLFVLSSQGSTYYPNPKSEIERDHLRYFKFIGRVIGKALFEECLLECYFVKSFYKIMAGEPLTFYDLEDFDNELFSNLKWCLENDVETLQQNFAIEQDYFGRTEEIELIPGGKQILVNNENKSQYIENHAHFKLYKSIQKQIENFLDGFYELVPKNLISIFNYKELELLISGLPNFDITDLKNNTEYMGYQQNSPQVQWLWEVLEQFENSDRAEFLQFVTGSSKVPVDGFKGLMGMRGPQKFTIAKIKTDDILRLPTGHTCFNQIDLPEYPSKEILHERVLTAIKETKGFGFA